MIRTALLLLLVALINSQAFRPTSFTPPPPPPPTAPPPPPPSSPIKELNIASSSGDGGPTGSTADGPGADSPPSQPQAMILANGDSSFSKSIRYPASKSGYQDARNAWNYLQKLGGGCCNNCNKICGFAFKLRNTNLYLTSRGSWYRFQSTSNPTGNRIFTLSQNEDCTWSIIDTYGNYVSYNTKYSGSYAKLIGSSSSRGAHERWWLERHGNHVHIQSAEREKYFWSRTVGYLLYKRYNAPHAIQMQFYPCDKKAWWNY